MHLFGRPVCNNMNLVIMDMGKGCHMNGPVMHLVNKGPSVSAGIYIGGLQTMFILPLDIIREQT